MGAGVTAAAVALAVVHAVWPSLKIDSVTLVLLIVALVPWIGGFVDKIELPGGVNLQLREVREQLDATRVRVDNASSMANAALSAATTPAGADSVDDMADEYVRVRAQMESSPERTRALDSLFGRLAVAAAAEAGFDWRAELASTNPGHQVAGIAYAYSAGSSEMLEPLVDLLETHPSPFADYWALRAINQIAARAGRFDPALRSRLAALVPRYNPGSGRYRELDVLLSHLRG